MTPSEWLRATMRQPWWALPADQFRIAMTLVAVCEVRDGAPRITAPMSDFERYFGLSRAKIRRALDALEKAGFCQVWTTAGRGGTTSIVLRDHRPFKKAAQGVLPAISTADQVPDMQAVTDIDPVEPGQYAGQITGHFEPNKAIDLAEKNVQMTAGGRAQDPDLLGASPDLRSSASRDHTRSTKISPIAGMAGWVDPAATPEVKARVAAESIPDRAWAAADYLRAQILAEHPTAVVGTRPWEAGWDFPVGSKAARLGDGGRSGLRQTWAQRFRVLHGRVLAAMQNGEVGAADGDAWAEIARSVRWLFHEQPIEPRFVVESPDSLAEKWDRIQTARKRTAQPKMGRGADGRPVDPATVHQFKRLGGEP